MAPVPAVIYRIFSDLKVVRPKERHRLAVEDDHHDLREICGEQEHGRKANEDRELAAWGSHPVVEG